MTKHEVLAGLGVTLAFTVAALWSQTASAQSITGIAAEIGITPESVVIADLDSPSASLVLGHLEGAAARSRRSFIDGSERASRRRDWISASVSDSAFLIRSATIRSSPTARLYW